MPIETPFPFQHPLPDRDRAEDSKKHAYTITLIRHFIFAGESFRIIDKESLNRFYLHEDDIRIWIHAGNMRKIPDDITDSPVNLLLILKKSRLPFQTPFSDFHTQIMFRSGGL